MPTVSLDSADEYFYRFGYRRGTEYALKLIPNYESYLDRAKVQDSILEIERFERCQPVFWPFSALLEKLGDLPKASFELGICDGVKTGLHLGYTDRISYWRASADE